MNAAEGSAGANTSNPERLRERLKDLLGVDIWVNAVYPAVAPTREDEVKKLLQGYPGEIMVIGQGTSFPAEFSPPTDALILLTSRMTETFNCSREDQVVEISGGWSIKSAREKLAKVGLVVPAWERFPSGTIGGRLAGVSSRHNGGRDGWTQSLLSIRIALPDGELLDFGSRCIKDVAGYDLRHLFTGSRGNLGVILRAVFRCQPKAVWDSYGYPVSVPKQAGRISPVLRKLLDPKGRMRSGV